MQVMCVFFHVMHTKANKMLFYRVSVCMCRFCRSSQKSHFTHSINTLEPNAWMAKVHASYMYPVYARHASYHCGVVHSLIHMYICCVYLVPAQVTVRGHGMQKIGTIGPYERWV